MSIGLEAGNGTGAGPKAALNQLAIGVPAKSQSTGSAPDATSFGSQLQLLVSHINKSVDAPGAVTTETGEGGKFPACGKSSTAANVQTAFVVAGGSSFQSGTLESGPDRASSTSEPVSLRPESGAGKVVTRSADGGKQAAAKTSSISLVSTHTVASTSEKKAVNSSINIKKEATADGPENMPSPGAPANLTVQAPVPIVVAQDVKTAGLLPQLQFTDSPPKENAAALRQVAGEDAPTSGLSGLVGETHGSQPWSTGSRTTDSMKHLLNGSTSTARDEGSQSSGQIAAHVEDSAEGDLAASSVADGTDINGKPSLAGPHSVKMEHFNQTENQVQIPGTGRPDSAQAQQVATASPLTEVASQTTATARAASLQSSSEPSRIEKVSTGSARRSTEQGALRTSHSTAAEERVEYGNHAAAVPVNQANDALPLSRDPASAHAGMNATSGNAVASANPVADAQPREAFSAIDAEVGPRTSNWIHAGAQRAEAGFQDPAIGWVGVRADLSGGSVHAALVPGSNEASQALSGHMAGLSAHLAAQHSPVESVTLAMPEGRAGSMETGQGPGQGTSQDMDRGSGQNPQQGGGYSGLQSSPMASAPATGASGDPEEREFAGRQGATTQPARLEGAHISVVA